MSATPYIAPKQENLPTVLDGEEILSKEYVTQNGYMWGGARALPSMHDSVEREIGPDLFERMAHDPIIRKTVRIRVNGVLTDDLAFAPGRSEDEVGEGEYKRYTQVKELAERIICGLDEPIWRTLEQLYKGSIQQGYKIGEVNYEYRMDRPTQPPPAKRPKQPDKQNQSLISRVLGSFKAAEPNPEPGKRGTSILSQPKIRLLPRSIRVKPRGAAYIVVDQFGNTLGILPAYRTTFGGRQVNNFGISFPNSEILTREKFVIAVNDPTDGDPRGNSDFRPAVNWYNFVNFLPKEYLRFCLTEALPIPILTLPEHQSAFMQERGPDGEKLFLDPEKRIPKMEDAVESGRRVIENMRNGRGVCIPNTATLSPYVGKGSSGDGVFPRAIRTAYNIIEESQLNQSLAQSEGEHQSKSASSTVEGRLNELFFWDKRVLSSMIIYDLIMPGIKYNLGDWALQYLPKLSLGDSEKRDWAEDLSVVSQAYFWGFIDDTQRAELMAWLSLPNPGPSRQELGMTATAQADINGNPAPPNALRPDKQPANKNRNKGNGTPKKTQAQIAALMMAENLDPSDEQEVADFVMRSTIDELRKRVQNAAIAKSGPFALGHHKGRR
jgi:hypothetical protein